MAAFKAAGHDIKTPFPRMDYDEAIRQYGIDKPDLRLPGVHGHARLLHRGKSAGAGDQCESAGDCDSHSKSRRAFAKRARRHQAHVPLQGRSTGVTKISSVSTTSFPMRQPRSRKKTATERRRPDRAGRRIGAGRAADGNPAGKRKVTPAELAIYASAGLLRVAWPRNMRTGMAFSKGRAIPRKITASSGSRTSRCSSGTRARSVDGRAPSVHLSARGGHGLLEQGSSR